MGSEKVQIRSVTMTTTTTSTITITATTIMNGYYYVPGSSKHF